MLKKDVALGHMVLQSDIQIKHKAKMQQNLVNFGCIEEGRGQTSWEKYVLPFSMSTTLQCVGISCILLDCVVIVMYMYMQINSKHIDRYLVYNSKRTIHAKLFLQ